MIFKRITALLIVCFSLFMYVQTAAEQALAAKSEITDTSLKPVQVFDVSAGKVIKSVKNDAEFQSFAETWVKSVTGLSPQLMSDASCSFVYRIPLKTPATVKMNDISVTSSDLFMFYCTDKPPLLLMFDEKRRPYLFLFSADIKPFINKIGIPAS